MRGALLFFSGTGNTEYVGKQIKAAFHEKAVECSIFDIRKKKRINDEYDFLVFGAPIHADMFPQYFISWVNDNISCGRGRPCMVFSTQADSSAAGPDELSSILTEKGLEVVVQEFIKMPNNYYVEGYKKPSAEEIEILKEQAGKKAREIVEKFLSGEKNINGVSPDRLEFGKQAYGSFLLHSAEWAKRNITVDYDLCVKCGKCAKNCPVHNISMRENIEFDTKCISCQRCIHACPVNAFLYRGKKISQYKI